MLGSLLRMLYRAAELSVSYMGTTTLALFVGILIFLLVVLVRWRRKGFEEIKKEWLGDAGVGLLLTLGAWLLLFAWCVVKTVYDDHRNWVSTNAVMRRASESKDATIADLRAQISTKDAIIVELEGMINTPPRIVYRDRIVEPQTETKEAEREKKRRARAVLAKALEEGQTVQQSIVLDQRTSHSELAERANAWASKTETLLRSNLGEEYVIRFRSAAGLLSFSPGQSPPEPDSMEKAQLWSALNNRLTRLYQFLEELKD